jgi:SAM-dependent methyltransferase
MQIRAGIFMERLPFPDASFGAAVSQFGFEYSQTPRSANEIARVLRPGAPLSFLVHHAQSPIVRAEHIHERALRAVTGDSVRSLFLSGDAAALRQKLGLLARQHVGNAAIALASTALPERITLPLELRLKVWEAVVEALAPDLILCAGLRSSCVAPDDLDNWLRPLCEGFRNVNASPLSVMGDPLAWAVEALRKG